MSKSRYDSFFSIVPIVALVAALGLMAVGYGALWFLSVDNFSFAVFYGGVGLVVGGAFVLYRFFGHYPAGGLRGALFVSAFYLAGGSLAFDAPVLSDDVERYVWEGFVQNLGYNPYAIAPGDEVFSGEVLNKRVNHPHMPAIYPPGAQLLFRVLASVSASVVFFKLFLGLCGLALVLFLYFRRDLFGEAYLLASLFPFVAIESAWSGHLDVVGAGALAGGVWALRRENPFWAGSLLGLAGMVKLLPFLFVPLFFRAAGRKGRGALLAGVLWPVALYGFYASAGGSLFFSLGRYSQEWVFSGFAYTLLYGLSVPLVGGAEGGARMLVALLFVGWFVYTFVRRGGLIDVGENIYATWFGLVILSPVVYPWYLVWLLPFAGRGRRLSFLLAFGGSFCSYLVLEGWLHEGVWRESPGLTLIAYLPALIAFFYEESGGRD